MQSAEHRAEIARLNGSKSRGPVTAEGKEHSRRNAITHGRRAEALRLMVPPHSSVLASEERQEFYQLHDRNVAKYKPADERELEVVREISDLDWKLSRNAQMETALYNRELLRIAPTIDDPEPALAHLKTTLAAFEALAGNKLLKDLRRENSRLRRELRAVEQRLIFLKKHFPATELNPPSTEQDKEDNLFIVEGAEPELHAAGLPENPPNEPSEPVENSPSLSILDALARELYTKKE